MLTQTPAAFRVDTNARSRNLCPIKIIIHFFVALKSHFIKQIKRLEWHVISLQAHIYTFSKNINRCDNKRDKNAPGIVVCLAKRSHMV